MSSLTVYDAVIPVFIKGLKTFDHILNKAEEHAKANNVQNATKTVKTNIARLTGVELEPFENKEKTIEDLHKRIQEALDLLSKVDAATVNAKADNEVDL
ncbi:helix-turn-helix-domain containing protein type [Colletotrichum tofieldiae]|nr:helix-turn-helix-domain containing protein type [Colletotrichum tofieldiae]